MRALLALLLPIALLACGKSTNEDRYPEQVIKAQCKFAKECLPYAFYRDYSDVKDCVDNGLDYMDEMDVDYGDCDFDKDAAKDCLRAYDASCKDAADDDDFFKDCEDVWDCGGGNTDDSGR